MNVPNLINDIIGCIRGQMPLRHCWDALPVRIQGMVRDDMAEVISAATKADEGPAPTQDVVVKPVAVAKKVSKKVPARK